MAKVAYDFSVEADVGAESILAAATDFSARRLKLWPGITAARYRVLHSGDKWAEVVEGTGPFWSRERYEWATPGLVTATQLDSNVAVPGGLWQMRVVARGDGGSHIEIRIRRTTKGLLGWIFAALITISGGNRFLAGQFRRTLRVIQNDARIS